MGKMCAVPSCTTGQYREVKRRKELGLRPLSFFSAPKCPNQRRIWNEVIGHALTDKDYVCALHFDDADIEEFYRGSGSSPFHRLKRNAKPMTNNNDERKIDEPELVPAMELALPAAEEPVDYVELPLAVEENIPTESEYCGFADHLRLSDTEDASINDIVLEEIEETVVPGVEILTIYDVAKHFDSHPLRRTWCWMMNPRRADSIVFTQLDPETATIRLHLDVASDLSLQLRTPDEKVRQDIALNFHSVRDIEDALQRMEITPMCCGTGIEANSRSERCPGIVNVDDYSRNVREKRCLACRRLRKTLQNLVNYKKTTISTRYARSKSIRHLEHQQKRRLQRRVRQLKELLGASKRKCAAVEEQALLTAISEMPPSQQEAVKACFNAAKVGKPQQRRYTIDWVYECVLMRIKNSKLYEHIRTHNILALPTTDTLDRYTRRLKSSYGFQNAVFDCLRKKASRMEPAEKCGTLLVDEMALSEGIYLDRRTMEFNGFVYLGRQTSAEHQNIRADHALVFMFQPFRGKWVQVLGAFLSKNSVTSKDLHKLLLECILMLGNAGFHVDVVTMDGAQWNRGVWSILGIKNGNYSCEHPCDSTKRLWMMSDFPHLTKCLRNGIMAVLMFWTPKGIVKKKHWEALLKYEGYTKPNLKIAYKLTPAHLQPKGYQKMNVPLAFQLFSLPVRVAMQTFRDDSNYHDLRDATPTIEFCELVDNLISAMMSRIPSEALRPDDTCKHKKAIEDFDKFLRTWQEEAKQKNMPFPVSASTVNGLKITLGGTLELLTYLHDERNFDYLMTARLNQDALERFFGMMRSACGSNDHPDPALFIQVFRLMCSYSLVKPPKGGNVSGTELLETLMDTKESMAASEAAKQLWFDKIDKIIEPPSEIIQENHSVRPNRRIDSQSLYCQSDHLSCHDYDVTSTSEKVQAYVAGYVARKIGRLTKCSDCIASLINNTFVGERDAVIDAMSKFGGLIYPSDKLLSLTGSLEAVVMDVAGKLTIKMNTLHQIADKCSQLEDVEFVGCPLHREHLTKMVINHYLVMRGHFLVRSVNENNNARKIRTKDNRKRSRL